MITADIEKKVERELIKTYGDKLQAQVLVVPHHGSKTSSTQAFIDAVKPEIALLPVGYRNRYHHPKPEIVERYKKAAASITNSAQRGAVIVLFSTERGPIIIDEYRRSHRKYWNHIIDE